MIGKLADKIKKEKTKMFNATGCFAGVCPDCGQVLEYRSYFQEFNCTAKDCAFVADKNGNRVWDNEKRDENLKRLQEESDYKIKNGLDLY